MQLILELLQFGLGPFAGKLVAIAIEDTRVDEAKEALIDEHAARRRSAEAKEGLASFAEKRKPAWRED